MTQHPKRLSEKLFKQIFSFCSHVAGSCQITAACIVGDCALGLLDAKATVEVLLVIRDFPQKLMNYVNVSDERNAVVFAVDKWIFERDVDKGFLGEALAGKLIFPYVTLMNKDYLHVQEVKLKKRLILELLENLVLDFPELSYEIRIKPEYFMYETMLSRARLYPPMIYALCNFMQEKARIENVENVLYGYLEASEELKKKGIISFSEGYVKISKEFAEDAKKRKRRFKNLFKTAQRTLFSHLLGVFPETVSILSLNREFFLKFQKTAEEKARVVTQLEDSKKYLYIPTASGLVPLAGTMDIEAFSKKVLSTSKDAKIEVEEIGGILNDVYSIKVIEEGKERRVIVKSFKDWSSFKWFPLTLWTVGTRSFAVLGRSRMEREYAINQLLHSNGFAVPKILHVNHDQRLIFMEYVEGESLEKIIKRFVESKTAEERDENLKVINMVGEKFAQVHAFNISLGDTKPENILIGKNGEICLLDFEQASRNGDKVWDLAEFLYYAGHYISPFAGTRPAELITKAFVDGYLKAGGNPKILKSAGNPKYTKVFSVFTFPHIILAISNVCRKIGKEEAK